MRAGQDDAARKNAVYRPAANGSMSAKKPVALRPGPHLFIDDFLIDQTSDVRRRVNCPVRDPKIPNPLISGKADGNFQPYMTVVRDAGTGRFRVWYCARTEDRNPIRAHIATMESADGIEWRRPARVLEDPAPIEVGCSVLDEGPGFADPAARYKLAWCWWAPKTTTEGLRIAVSADGLEFKPLSPGVVLSHSHDINNLHGQRERARRNAGELAGSGGQTGCRL